MRILALLLLTASIPALVGCAPADRDAWVLTPVVVDHGFDEPSDISYTVDRIADDTAGGYWTESAGSWFHIDSDGVTAARFNVGFAVDAFAALSPTTLIVSVVGEGMREFDTESQTLSVTSLADEGADAIAVRDDGTVVVVRGGHVSDLVPGGAAVPLASDTTFTGDSIAMDIGPKNEVVVASDEGLTTVSADGSVEREDQRWDGRPIVSIRADGSMVLRAPAGAPRQNPPVRVNGGSDHAREMLLEPDDDPSIFDGPLMLRSDDTDAVLEFTRATCAALALANDEFVFICCGYGDEAVLATVTPPAAAR